MTMLSSNNIYAQRYNEKDLYELTGAKKYGEEDYIEIENVTNELRFKANVLQQKIIIQHHWKPKKEENYKYNWNFKEYNIWVDIQKFK